MTDGVVAAAVYIQQQLLLVIHQCSMLCLSNDPLTMTT